MGYQPVAVVILHVNKYGKKKVTRKFKSGGLQERHVVATWKLGNHLSSAGSNINLQFYTDVCCRICTAVDSKQN